MDLVIAGKVVWAFFAAVWFVIRRPFESSANAAPVAVDGKTPRERFLIAATTVGIGVIPLIYVVFGWPAFADRDPRGWAFVLGTAAGLAGLLLFWLTHKTLGDLWSSSLQIKEGHRLVTSGIYGRLRHPMYAAFWLIAICQLLLLPNWFAGLAGLVGFGLLYFARVGREERMMEDRFGDEYRSYRARTKRLIPYIH